MKSALLIPVSTCFDTNMDPASGHQHEVQLHMAELLMH